MRLKRAVVPSVGSLYRFQHREARVPRITWGVRVKYLTIRDSRAPVIYLPMSSHVHHDYRSKAIEYALIAALIAVAAIAAFTLVGTNLSNTISSIANHL